MPYDEDYVDDLAADIIRLCPSEHVGEFINALMKVVLTLTEMGGASPELVKELFTHFYREYCRGLEDNDV